MKTFSAIEGDTHRKLEELWQAIEFDGPDNPDALIHTKDGTFTPSEFVAKYGQKPKEKD